MTPPEHHDPMRTPVSITAASWDDPHLQPASQRPEQVERVITALFFIGLVCFGAFGAAYWQNWAPWTYGATLGGGMLAIGIGLVAWGKYLMPRGPFVEDRHELASDRSDVEAFTNALVVRGGGVVKRRKVLGGMLGGGLGIFGIVAMFPLLRSLGPLPGKTLTKTNWKKGSYLVDQSGRRVQVDDLAVGSVLTVFPEGFENSDVGQAVDQTIVVRIGTTDFTTIKGKTEGWGPQGYLAYSKVCTHLGCPVGLYERALELLVCPCHQSMFNVADGCVPIFGPAPRPLPQLPLYIDSSGYLRSQRGYDQPIGPGYWERNS